MTHLYAGFLGPLAFITALMRGLVHGSSIEAVLPGAWCCLLLFSIVGLIIGWVSEWVIEDSVRTRIKVELAAKAEVEPVDAETA